MNRETKSAKPSTYAGVADATKEARTQDTKPKQANASNKQKTTVPTPPTRSPDPQSLPHRIRVQNEVE